MTYVNSYRHHVERVQFQKKLTWSDTSNPQTYGFMRIAYVHGARFIPRSTVFVVGGHLKTQLNRCSAQTASMRGRSPHTCGTRQRRRVPVEKCSATALLYSAVGWALDAAFRL